MADLNGGQLAARQLQLSGVDTIFGVVAGPTVEFMAGAAELFSTMIVFLSYLLILSTVASIVDRALAPRRALQPNSP